jgi:uncharacterized protein YmfQ (DUF2313 family)
MAGVLNADSYLSLLKSLLPKGAAWMAEVNSTLYNLLAACSIEFGRMEGRISDLQNEIDPLQTVECVTDWERVLGLPDTCDGIIAQTLQQRRNAIQSKLTATGGQSKQYYIDVAAAHGFDITITEFFPFRFGMSHFGDVFGGGALTHTWQVNAQPGTTIFFRFGQSRFGEPFELVQNEGLECLMQRLKPAHTEVIFNYA